MTTDAQRDANRANAKGSTGPRTSAGKSRSSRNALVHGGFACRTDAISASILREDADEVQALIDAIVDELDPQTPLEQAAAHTVATRLLNRARIDRLTAPLVEAAETGNNDMVVGTARNEVRAGRDILEALNALDDEPVDVDFDWVRLYFDVEDTAGVGHSFQIEHVWDDGELRMPRTVSECLDRFRAVVVQTHGSCENAREHATNRVLLYGPIAEEEERAERAVQARQLIEEFDRTTQLADRVDRSVDRSFESYIKTRDINTSANPNPRNEPNLVT